MKIICVGINYLDHAKEFNNTVPDIPLFFLKPDSAIISNNKPFFYPDFSKDIQHEIEVVIKINRLGKNIAPEFAHRYYNEIGLGIDFKARDIHKECKKKGKPWEIATTFDGAAPISKFVNKNKFKDINNINFHLDVNGRKVQEGNTKNMIFSIDELIAYVSRFFTLKIGDLLFTGTPAGVKPVKINDKLEAYLEGEKMMNFFIK